MFRNANTSDFDAFCALWQQVFGDDRSFSQVVFHKFAGPQNIFVAEEAGRLQSILCSVPVSLQAKKGAYLYGLATEPACRGQQLMTGLMQFAEEKLRASGAEFAALIPASSSLFDFYEKRGYVKAFELRRLTRTIKRNLWAQADFDAVTAKALEGLRTQYVPDSVRLNEAGMIAVLTDLYASGITIVSSSEGYGLYFQRQETLEFIELFADGDRAAEKLMEAAREKTGATEAVITLGTAENLFLGEGQRQDYGMIHFLSAPFDVSESYMRLMLDNEE